MVTQKNIHDNTIIIEALNNIAVAFELTEQDIYEVIGNDLFDLNEIQVASNAGKRALSLIRIYQCLFSRFNGNMEHSKLWLTGFNKGTGGIPAEQIKDNDGRERVMEYLESMRYK